MRVKTYTKKIHAFPKIFYGSRRNSALQMIPNRAGHDHEFANHQLDISASGEERRTRPEISNQLPDLSHRRTGEASPFFRETGLSGIKRESLSIAVYQQGL